jgi:hypothetical protein
MVGIEMFNLPIELNELFKGLIDFNFRFLGCRLGNNMLFDFYLVQFDLEDMFLNLRHSDDSIKSSSGFRDDLDIYIFLLIQRWDC